MRFPLKTRQVMSEVIYLNRYERELLLKTRGVGGESSFFHDSMNIFRREFYDAEENHLSI